MREELTRGDMFYILKEPWYKKVWYFIFGRKPGVYKLSHTGDKKHPYILTRFDK